MAVVFVVTVVVPAVSIVIAAVVTVAFVVLELQLHILSDCPRSCNFLDCIVFFMLPPDVVICLFMNSEVSMTI